jgi:hypothetical protein
VLVWRILFPSDIVAGMLQDSFVSTTVQSQGEKCASPRAAHRRSSRQSAQVQRFGARLENFVSVGYCCRHATELFVFTTVHTKAKNAHRCGRHADNRSDNYYFWKVVLHWLEYANQNPTL